MARLNLVVADDQALMRDALRVVLEGDDDFEIVGEAESGAHLVELLGRVEVDVAIVDLAMPPLDGLECLERIRDEHPAVTRVRYPGLTACIRLRIPHFPFDPRRCFSY